MGQGELLLIGAQVLAESDFFTMKSCVLGSPPPLATLYIWIYIDMYICLVLQVCLALESSCNKRYPAIER